MLFSRSRARFEAASSAPVSLRTRSRALSEGADADDYGDFFSGRHAFECVSWSCSGEIYGMDQGVEDYQSGEPVPDGILDDRAFARGFFCAPFQQVVDCSGDIRAYDLPPEITLRQLSQRLCAAVAQRQASDGLWDAHGELLAGSERAAAFARAWVEKMHWGGEAAELCFGDVYWQGRPFIEGYTIEQGTAAGGGLVYVCSWGS